MFEHLYINLIIIYYHVSWFFDIFDTPSGEISLSRVFNFAGRGKIPPPEKLHERGPNTSKNVLKKFAKSSVVYTINEI